jgi:hypothetical protein
MTVNQFFTGSRFVIACLFCVLTVGIFAEDKKEKEKTEIRQMSQETLTRLYKLQPSAQAAIQKSYGYAIFQQHRCKDPFRWFRQW